MPSFQGINTDCGAIIKKLRGKLRDKFRQKEVCIKLLLSVVYFCLKVCFVLYLDIVTYTDTK